MRKARYGVAKVGDLLPNTGKIVLFGENGGECALFYHAGLYHATGSLCPHQNAPLENAPAIDGQIVCQRHGYRFDLKSGECVTAGGYGVPVFPVEIEGDTIYIAIWEFD